MQLLLVHMSENVDYSQSYYAHDNERMGIATVCGIIFSVMYLCIMTVLLYFGSIFVVKIIIYLMKYGHFRLKNSPNIACTYA